MKDTIVAIWGKEIKAWEYGGTVGKRTITPIGSRTLDEDVFTRDGASQSEDFLRTLNGEKAEKTKRKSRLPEFISSLEIDKLQDFLALIDGTGKKRPVARLIVADIDLYIRQVELPFGDPRKARIAAPSVVVSTLPFEESFLLDVVPLASDSESGRYLAVCVRTQEIEQLEDLFHNAGFSLEQVIPGFLLLLPEVEKLENSTGEAIYLDGKIAAKAGADWQKSGLVRILPHSMIEDDLTRSTESGHLVMNITGTNDGFKKGEQALPKAAQDSIVNDFFNHPVLSAFNLIGAKIAEFKDKREVKTKRYLRIASIFLILVSLIITLEGTKHFTKKKASLVKQAVNVKFREIIKGASMVDPVAQIKERISQAEEELALFPGRESTFYGLLVTISSSLTGNEGIIIREINYTRGKFTITGEGPDQDSATLLKERLTEKENRVVEITETGPSAIEGRIKFKLSIS